MTNGFVCHEHGTPINDGDGTRKLGYAYSRRCVRIITVLSAVAGHKVLPNKLAFSMQSSNQGDRSEENCINLIARKAQHKFEHCKSTNDNLIIRVLSVDEYHWYRLSYQSSCR